MASYNQGTPIEINDTFSLSGVPTNPTTVLYTIVAPDGTETTFQWPGAAEITNSGAGEFTLALGAPAMPGLYHYDVDATGAVVASRQGAFTVIPDAQAQEVPWVVTGPASPWAASQDVWNCCGQPMETVDGEECPVDFTYFAYAASELLFAYSGRQYFGLGSKVSARPPCRPGCGCGQVLSRGYVIPGPWWNWWGGFDEGPCDPSRVLLSGYPVRQITEVKIDGVIVDPDDYGLWKWRWLVRKNDGVWPRCQDLSLDDTEDGTWSVSYTYGLDPPISGQLAATELACELYKACSGGECALPTGVTRIVRQGVVIEKMAFAAWGLQAGIWKTGLTRVDAFLNFANPKGIQRRATVWSPARHLQYVRRALT